MLQKSFHPFSKEVCEMWLRVSNYYHPMDLGEFAQIACFITSLKLYVTCLFMPYSVHPLLFKVTQKTKGYHGNRVCFCSH